MLYSAVLALDGQVFDGGVQVFVSYSQAFAQNRFRCFDMQRIASQVFRWEGNSCVQVFVSYSLVFVRYRVRCFGTLPEWCRFGLVFWRFLSPKP